MAIKVPPSLQWQLSRYSHSPQCACLPDLMKLCLSLAVARVQGCSNHVPCHSAFLLVTLSLLIHAVRGGFPLSGIWFLSQQGSEAFWIYLHMRLLLSAFSLWDLYCHHTVSEVFLFSLLLFGDTNLHPWELKEKLSVVINSIPGSVACNIDLCHHFIVDRSFALLEQQEFLQNCKTDKITLFSLCNDVLLTGLLLSCVFQSNLLSDGDSVPSAIELILL